MSSARGAAGAVKPKLHNVNSIYAGKNHSAVKAPGLGKHGGLQSLGKTTAVVRRMPPPATLPSLRAESQGQDPNVSLVPQGGSGWHKENIIANGSTTENVSLSKSPLTASGTQTLTSSSSVGGNLGSHTTDLRPTWAKQASCADMQAVAPQNVAASTASSRDFPSLAAATATSGKQPNITLTETLKPQKSGSWRVGGSSALSKNEGDELISVPHPCSGVLYPTPAPSVRSVDRKLPSRYYDGSVAPPPPPSGVFTVPKLPPTTQTTSSQIQSNVASEKIEEPLQDQENQKDTSALGTALPSSQSFPTNVAVPPPNYSLPPPNYHATQENMRYSTGSSESPVSPAKYEETACDIETSQHQRNGHGVGGYGERMQPINFDEPRYEMSNYKGATSFQGYQGIRSNDVRLCGRTESFSHREKIENDDAYMRSGESEWQSTQYGLIDREAESRRWRNAGGGGQGASVPIMSIGPPQNAYGIEREDDAGRRQNVEREAAIERSRQKRRIANRGSMPSESDSGNHPSYGSLHVPSKSENDSFSEAERPSSNCSLGQMSQDSASTLARRQDRVQLGWSGQQENYLDYEIRRFDERSDHGEKTSQPEYRMLRRPDSKESAEVQQQLSSLSVQEEDEDELQFTKLSVPATKVIKRVAPGSGTNLQSAIEREESVQSVQESVIKLPLQSHQPQRPYSDDRAQEKKHRQQQQAVHDKRRQQSAYGDSVIGQNAPNTLVGNRVPLRSVKSTDDGVKPQESEKPAKIVLAPPPADNVWEKRAEERESAERERAAQRDMQQQIRLQQQFPLVNEQTVGLYLDDVKAVNDEMRMKEFPPKSDAPMQKQKGNRNRNQNRTDRNYGLNYPQTEYYGPEEEDEGGRLFRGQREFVNSRVFSRSGRGMSAGTGRGGRGYVRGAYSSLRRGLSVPHQPAHSQFGEHHERQNQRRGRRHEELQVQEFQEDNFSNMGEFHVEDTYAIVPPQNQKTEAAGAEIDGTKIDSGKFATGERRAQRQQRSQRSNRAQQQLYQPRQMDESARSGGRRLGSGRTSVRRGSLGNQSQMDRRKKKGIKEEDSAGTLYSDEQSGALVGRDENVRRSAARGLHQQKSRGRRYSPPQRSGSLNSQSTGLLMSDRVGQIKSPVTSEGQEEWETASESSDIVERSGTERRRLASLKHNASRKLMRPNAGTRREKPATASIRTGNSSKNGKPASTTSHAAVRSVQPLKEEVASAMVEPRLRDPCRDGLAGVDINNAGVIVIDDRPDEHGEEASENGGDFEEVLSKKSKRLRQQQINEQLEAEERRKMREKEKVEKRKAKQLMKKHEKRGGPRDDRPVVNKNSTLPASKPSETIIKNAGAPVSSQEAIKPKQSSPVITTGGVQNTLNTTVWNSSIMKEKRVRQPTPPLENHPVIPSPIARPTPKTSGPSANAIPSKNGVDVWAGIEAEQRQRQLNKAPKSPTKTTVPSAADGSSSRSEATGLSIRQLDANDDERLKQKLDKVKDIWPGQPQFTNNLLEGNDENGAMPPMVTEKTQSSTSAHGPNVAKVRPQPQTNDQTTNVPVPLKDTASTASSVQAIPPPSPVACIPPGAYLQSLSQIPPPAALPPYSMILSDAYGPHSTTSPPAQTLFGGPISASQAPSSRSRPPSFIEQSSIFIHPPPSGAAPSSMTWSNSSPQIELLAGIGATPPLSAQATNAVQRFQFSSQVRSNSAFGGPPHLLNGNAKLPPITAPPPHPHQIPPPIHPHSFFAPPPEIITQLQGSGLGAVGSQRVTETSSLAEGMSRTRVNVLGQMPLSHLQQQFGFSQQTQSGFPISTAASFNQGPALHPFSAPPPPLRYPPATVPPLNDTTGVIAAGWGKPTMNPQFPMKYTNGGSQQMSIGRSSAIRNQQMDRWSVPISVSFPHSSLVFQSHAMNKENGDILQTNVERFASQQCGNMQSSPDEGAHASSNSSVSAPAPETLESSSHSKKAAKV